ncbi:MAG: glycosyltransferase family 39 protein [Armatimonadota bacterium]
MKNRKLILMGIVLLALALRLFDLGRESLWIDEGFSLRDALGLDLAGETRPLYFLFLAGWMKLGLHSEFWLRLPSALFGAAGVWLLYALGRRLFGTRPALLASAFMAVSVLHVNHSREVRMYSLAVLLTLASTYFLLVSLEERRARFVTAYAATALLGLLTYPLTVLVLAAHGVFLLAYYKAYRAQGLIATQLGVSALWLPWLYNNMRVTSAYSEGYTSILEKPTPLGVVALLGRFFLWKWSDPGTLLAAGAMAFSFFVLVLALRGLRDFRRADAALVFTVLWLALPIAGVILLSYTVSNMWMVHYLIPASPALFLLVARGVCIGGRRLGTAAVAVVFALTLARLGLYYEKNMRPEWRRAVAYVQAHETPGDVIGIYYGGNRHVFNYYYRGGARWAPVGSEEIASEHFSGWNALRVREMLQAFPLSGRRFWLVLSNHDYAGGGAIVNYMEENYRVLDHRYYSQLELLLVDSHGERVPAKEVALR